MGGCTIKNNKLSIDQIEKQSKAWVTNFIVKHDICPFAGRVVENDSIHFEITQAANMEDQLQTLILACTQMDNHAEIETTLAIYPKGLDDFDEYLDFLEISNALMQKQQYEGVYQLASFHPDYCFDGVAQDDASNYTNRSPYPMLHILRESSLEKALSHYPNPENIPDRNIALMRELGVTRLEELLSEIENS